MKVAGPKICPTNSFLAPPWQRTTSRCLLEYTVLHCVTALSGRCTTADWVRLVRALRVRSRAAAKGIEGGRAESGWRIFMDK